MSKKKLPPLENLTHLERLNLTNLKRLKFEDVCFLFTGEYATKRFKWLIKTFFFSTVGVKEVAI